LDIQPSSSVFNPASTEAGVTTPSTATFVSGFYTGGHTIRVSYPSSITYMQCMANRGYIQ